MIFAIIVAGGLGKRIGTSVPKQFLLLKGHPVLWYTVRCFDECHEIGGIVLVTHKDWLDPCYKIAEGFEKIRKITIGGDTRQKSVWQGLKMIEEAEIVLVHDGVRPLVPKALISQVIKETKRWGAVVPALAAKETIKWVEDRFIVKTLDRERVFLVQTPQGFKFDLLKEAYLKAKKESIVATDDASLVERLGKKIKIIPGANQNIKITSAHDLKLAEYYLDSLSKVDEYHSSHTNRAFRDWGLS